jgi:hypothetical protein
VITAGQYFVSAHKPALALRKCINEEHKEYKDLIVPEGLRHRTSASFVDDIWLFERSYTFNMSQIRPDLQQNIHIWHGTGDKQVCSDIIIPGYPPTLLHCAWR